VNAAGNIESLALCSALGGWFALGWIGFCWDDRDAGCQATLNFSDCTGTTEPDTCVFERDIDPRNGDSGLGSDQRPGAAATRRHRLHNKPHFALKPPNLSAKPSSAWRYHFERQSQGNQQVFWRFNLTLYNAWRFQRRWASDELAVTRLLSAPRSTRSMHDSALYG
jgi:hypothetical protein